MNIKKISNNTYLLMIGSLVTDSINGSLITDTSDYYLSVQDTPFPIQGL